MASPTYADLQGIKEILEAKYRGAKVQKIRDMGDDRVSFELFAKGEKCWLQIWVVPQCTGIYFSRNQAISSPAGAGNFVKGLRKYLGTPRLCGSELHPNDRVLHLDFKAGDTDLQVVYEGFGGSPNLYLLDSNQKILHQLRARSSGGRNLHPGSVYIPLENKPLVSEAGQEEPDEESKRLVGTQQALEEYFLVLQKRTQMRTQLKPLRRAEKRLRRLVKGLRRDIEQCGNPELLRNEGHVLGASLAQITRGLSSITLDNPGFPELPETLTITLDPSKSPQENMDLKYRRARRSERTLAQASLRLKAAEAELAQRVAEREKAESLDIDVQAEPASDTEKIASAPPKATPAKGVERYAHLHACDDGSLILVGKNAKANDELLRRYANGNDHWLHVRDARGSHVIVKPPPGREASEVALKKAASLAAGYSSLRSEAQVDVRWTQCKYVRATKGSAAGTVHVSKSRTIRVTPARSKGV